MATLKDFLQSEWARRAEEDARNQAVVSEWRGAVERLFGQVRVWLADADPNRAIEISEDEHEVREGSLGRYQIPQLSLRAFGKWIGIIPKARNTVGTVGRPPLEAPQRAKGRVDVTDEVRRYVLYRVTDEHGAEAWVIDDLQTGPKPLDRQAFEDAILSYLR